MIDVEDKTQLVAYCGLYCGGCGGYKRGKCKACKSGGGFSSCKIRKCCIEREIRSCAECAECMNCKVLNNFISKIISFVLRSNRMGNLKGIRELGIDKWAEQRSVSGKK